MKLPLTDFLIAMLKADPAAIRRADPVKLAARSNVDPVHVAGYLGLCGVDVSGR